MTKSTPDQVISLLYNQMTHLELSNMTADQLIFFYGNLNYWAELTKNRINTANLNRRN